jgi:hypothetical protein
MKLSNPQVAQNGQTSLDAQVLQYLFVSEQAKKFEEQRKELSEIIKAQVPSGEYVMAAGHKVSVSEYDERRFMPMAEAEKIVGTEIISHIVKTHTKQRLNIK